MLPSTWGSGSPRARPRGAHGPDPSRALSSARAPASPELELEIARDLHAHFARSDFEPGEADWNRYPWVTIV